LIERLQNHPNIKRGAAGVALLGTLAAGSVYKANAAGSREATLSVSAAALKNSEIAHDENMQLIRSLRASIVRAQQSEAARDAARKARVEAAIPTPYAGPLPTETPSATLSPTPIPSVHHQTQSPNTPSPIEVPAVAGQYWFGKPDLLQSLGPEGKHNAMLLYALGIQKGLSTAEIGCLDNIGAHESRFQVHDPNPTSEADGIPQANPASKMASAGADWRDNPITQETWMIGYVDGRYGGPCQAWAYWERNGNY